MRICLRPAWQIFTIDTLHVFSAFCSHLCGSLCAQAERENDMLQSQINMLMTMLNEAEDVNDDA